MCSLGKQQLTYPEILIDHVQENGDDLQQPLPCFQNKRV